MRYSTKAWIGLGVYVAAVEWFAPKDELLSEAFDRWLTKYPDKVIAPGWAIATVLHLLNLIPNQVDPYHQVGKISKAFK